MTEATILRKYTLGEQIQDTDTFIRYRGKIIQKGEAVVSTLIKPEIAPAGEFLARYEIIYRALSRLESPQLVKVLDRGEYKQQAVFVQESIEGTPLAEMIAGGSGLPVDLVLSIARQLGEYLEALHRQGMIQGVFDPQNLLLTPDAVLRVTDLGVAQGLNIGELLAAGKIKARSCHAPELLRGGQPDARTDFYSLGAVLFTTLTGKDPDAKAAAGKTPTLADFYPSRLRPGLPPELDELVAKCLHPDPNRRIQSAAEFLDGVEEVRGGMAVGAGDTILGIEDSLVGQTLGAYRLVERLGQGGMATVYKAYEPALGRYVAVKVLPQFFARDPNFLKRFRREAKVVAQLSHPNIVPIHSYGEEGDIIYITMQFVEGGTLKHGKEKVFTSEEALRLLLPVTRALGYAHARGIVHRDIKPSNVLLSEGNWPVLADFGLAQMAEASVKLTGTGVGMGTPAYMSPEQGQGAKVDARTDIYSLGIMLYEMVTGDVPFHADTPMAIVIKHLTAPMPMPRQVNPNVPIEIEEIILKATAKNPDDRYQTAEELALPMEEALEKLIIAKKARVVEERTQPVPEEVVPARKAEVTLVKPLSDTPTVVAKHPSKKKGNLKRYLIILFGVLVLGAACSILVWVFKIISQPKPWEPTMVWATATSYSTSAPVILPTSYYPMPGLTPMIFEDMLGPILFQDDFEGQISPRWDFSSSIGPAPSWEAIEMDGRTVMHSPPTHELTDFAAIPTTGVNFAVQFDFFFLKPNEYGGEQIIFYSRITDCPPGITDRQGYSLGIDPNMSSLGKFTCGEGYQNIDASFKEINSKRWHTLELMFIGNHIRILIDSEIFFDYIDNDEPFITDGRFRIWRNGNEILIDNFKIYEVIPTP